MLFLILQLGRRGHNFSLFPHPRELRYCCNDWKQWTLRVGAVVLAPPAAVAAAALALPV
jgi:hypothetical protein